MSNKQDINLCQMEDSFDEQNKRTEDTYCTLNQSPIHEVYKIFVFDYFRADKYKVITLTKCISPDADLVLRLNLLLMLRTLE